MCAVTASLYNSERNELEQDSELRFASISPNVSSNLMTKLTHVYIARQGLRDVIPFLVDDDHPLREIDVISL